MFAYIQGKLDTLEATHAIIEVNGIGYFLKISLYTYSQLTREGKSTVKLYTYLQVQENAHNLFGFTDPVEKELFLELISVSGIGANTAIVMLSSMSPDEIQQAIINGEAKTIQRIKGIGTKTAQRVILELQDKLAKNPLLLEHQKIASISAPRNIKHEALLALTTLGLAKNTAEKNIEKVLNTAENDITLEDLIKQSLKL